MTYTLHYTSADGPGPDATWSVYREQYATFEDEQPIDGTQEKVSTWVNEAEADLEARRLQEALGQKVGPYVKEIKGTFVRSDGQEVQFSIVADLGYQQWGNTTEVLGSTVYLAEALAQASAEFMESTEGDNA